MIAKPGAKQQRLGLFQMWNIDHFAIEVCGSGCPLRRKCLNDPARVSEFFIRRAEAVVNDCHLIRMNGDSAAKPFGAGGAGR